ncbi:MAG: hypothetical protein ACT4TC_24745, partial [Myxococcaceae bacterium]
MTEPSSPPPYEYGDRQIEDMSGRAFSPGRGRITGYLSATLGLMSMLAAVCFRYPTWLTTGELRDVYDVELLGNVLRGAMGVSLALGLFAFVRNRWKRLGAVGVLCTFAAFALGGWRAQPGPVADLSLSFGLDWLLLDLLTSAAVFIFVEKLFPKYPQQAILRPEWQLDLTYFAIN